MQDGADILFAPLTCHLEQGFCIWAKHHDSWPAGDALGAPELELVVIDDGVPNVIPHQGLSEDAQIFFSFELGGVTSDEGNFWKVGVQVL